MTKTMSFFIRNILFWLIYFAFFRTAFYFLDYPSLSLTSGLYSYFLVMYHALRLDLSASGYAAAVPMILFFLNGFIYHPVFKKITNVYMILLLLFFSLIQVSNIFLYKSWGTLINSRALDFLADPSEIVASLTAAELMGGIAGTAVLIYAFHLAFRQQVMPYFLYPSRSRIYKSGVTLLFIVFLALMVRGGWQQIPINESAAYFSSDVRLNHIATNPVWFLGHNLYQSRGTDEHTYHFYSDREAAARVKQLYTEKRDSPFLLKTDRPNVVFIILESYTADLIKSLGGDIRTAPEMEKLFADGLLFTTIYSSGFRTDQAFVSILSGFPAQPDKSIIRFPEKTQFLPSIPAEMRKQGYLTSFYYGGELGFSNLNSYLVNCGFDKVTGKNDFQSNQYNSKWGAHDEYVLTKQLEDLSLMKQPFFSVLMTLTSHEPYESPIATPFTGNDLPSKFRSVAWYTDRCLGDYFSKAKLQPWYDNTLYVIVADHGHLLPKERTFTDPAVRHIPLLITGGALKDEYRNKRIASIGNQNDIAATLLNQLKLPDSAFVWSNDLLNSERKNFAYLCMDNAIGWVSDSCMFVYHLQQQKLMYRNPAGCYPDTLSAKAYLQNLYKDFLKN